MRPVIAGVLVQEDQAMKTILLSLTAAAALAATVAPAVAQPYAHQGDGYHQDYGSRDGYGSRQSYVRPDNTRYVTDNLNRLERRISDAVYAHRISWQEARELKDELRAVRPIAWRVRNGQASGWERQRLDRTEARIESALNRYAQNDRYDWRRR
jgi:hypothetical protein